MLNHITAMGRLTRDPELRTTQSGVSVTSFTIAVDRDYSGQGQEKRTDFIDCVAWRSTGEFISKYFSKGRMIVVSGRLESNKWQDREGNNRTSWAINVDNCYFGDSKKDADSSGNYAQQGQYGAQSPQRGSAPPPDVYPDNSYTGSQAQFTELDDDDGDLPF